MKPESIAALVAELENKLPEAEKQIAEVMATLVVNFGPDNRFKRPPLVRRDMRPIAALATVLEHYLKWEDRARAAEKYIEKYKAWSKLAALGPDERQVITDLRDEWQNIKYNQELRKEFAKID